jgi:hypothetical protein
VQWAGAATEARAQDMPLAPPAKKTAGTEGVAIVLNDIGQLSFKDFFIIEFEVHATQIGP